MTLDVIHLRKLLAILFMDGKSQQSAIRSEIRRAIAHETGGIVSGGDFYAPFWADARAHVFGDDDLHSMVDVRIESNERRRNLYPHLRDGFLLWWNKRRRWTNEPFYPGRSLKTHFLFPGLNATVKVDSILSVRDGFDAERAIYPYFAHEPALSEEAARLGLWLLTQALPLVPPDEFRILDIIRGQTFSLDRYPLHGDEESVFRSRYAQLLEKYNKLKEEYG